jgi:hypothetical protein
MIKEFFSDIQGNFSMTRFWTSVCYATCTYIVIHNADKLDWTMFLAYAGIVSGTDLAKKMLLKK